MLRLGFLLVLTLVASAGALAQTAPNQSRPTGHVLPLPPASVAEVITDLSRLPAPVARTRERILTAARSGDLAQFAALVNEATPVFSFTDEKDPIAFWKANYPTRRHRGALDRHHDPELGFVRVDEGTQQEMYVWPYFVRMSLAALTPPQKVELFRIVTGADYRDMVAFGVYSFYRVGIGPDGTWHFFVAGD